jgi:hypothetical protein
MKVHEFGEKFGFLRLFTEHDFCELQFLKWGSGVEVNIARENRDFLSSAVML